MGEQTKIGPAGEIKLPANLLAHLGLHEGDALDVNVRADGTLELRRLEVDRAEPPAKHPLLALSGLFKSDAPPLTDDDRRRMIGNEILRKGRE